jgi:hypothetical protein
MVFEHQGLELIHAQARDRTHRVTRQVKPLDQGQFFYLLIGVQALSTFTHGRLNHAMACLPDSQSGHRNAGHLGDGTYSVLPRCGFQQILRHSSLISNRIFKTLDCIDIV